MGRKAKRRGSSVKLWRQQSEKEKRSGTKQNKPNIYIQVSSVLSAGGITLGKLGARQSGDCTQ